MKISKYISFALLQMAAVLCYGQQTPASPQKGAITITGATAHIGDGTIMENSTIVLEDGKITALGGAGTATKGTVINAEGKHIYPGFIIPCTSLGLVEVDAVRASDDQDEIGELIPHIRSLIAYNAESKVVESMRPNGVLLGQITPKGGRISGTSSIVQFDAWNWEDAAVKVDDAIHLNWPNSFKRGRWWEGEARGLQPNKEYAEEVAEVEGFVRNAAAYQKAASKELNPVFAAMEGVFNGKQKMFVHTNGQKEIMDAVTSLKKLGISQIVLVGGGDAHKVTDFLKSNSVSVLVNLPHGLPETDEDDYDLPYKLPKLLVDAGILTGIQNMDAANFQVRNLPFYAGQVAGQGLDKEKALGLISFNTAKILGIDDSYGSLAVGKSATLFISEGDALDMRTNKLSHAFIDGRELSLDTHQTELYQRYMGKYSGE
tara:strand:- start:47860 stop:49152 length:1293 start_codon:yes stop_codon:yes gene_type:complete